MRIGVVSTACKRPYYFELALNSWARARGVRRISRYMVALGRSHRESGQWKLVHEYGPQLGLLSVMPDRVDGGGLHRAIGEAGEKMFRSGLEFVIFTEEDVIVSDDIIEYFEWAADSFCDDPQVLLVNAHSVGGQGWDKHEPADDADADQETVRLIPYFNAWCWGTWRDRWPVLHRNWDWECNSGGPLDSGYDHNIASRIIPAGNYLAATPDASRSQNIGELEGWASTPWSFSFSQAQSFREHRDPVTYKLVSDAAATSV